MTDENEMKTVTEVARSGKLSVRNLIMFPLGGIGRDFLYAL